MISLVRSHDREGSTGSKEYEPFNGHIKTAEQRTIIEQYGDWYIGRWWVECYIWYSKEGPGRAAAPPQQAPPRCSKYNNPPINGQCTNFILFVVAL